MREPEDEDVMSQQSRRKQSFRKNSQMELKEGIVGLKNNSLYCYMNATLQCLACVDDLRDYVLAGKFERFSNKKTVAKNFKYYEQFSRCFSEMF